MQLNQGEIKSRLTKVFPELSVETIAKADPSLEHNAREQYEAIVRQIEDYGNKYIVTAKKS